MRRTLVLVPLLAAGLALALPDDAAAQSLWRAGKRNQASLIADNRAYRIGDIVTIVVREDYRVEDDQQVKLEKSTRDSATFTDEPDFMEETVEELFPIDWSSDRTHDGKAEVEKEGAFETSITATVIDVQPNGNLVIEGRRKVVIDSEEKWMTITGSVRHFDVSTDNTVESTLVANAKVTYEGTGPYTRSAERGWFETLIDFIWPF
jgi:flagellar L-ring protein precursor FlgH